MKKQELKKIHSIRITEEEKRKLRVYVAAKGTTVQSVIREHIQHLIKDVDIK